jgi:hypothetical protein
MGVRVEPTNPSAGIDSSQSYQALSTAAEHLYSPVRKGPLPANQLLRQFYWQNGGSQAMSRGNSVMKARPAAITPV